MASRPMALGNVGQFYVPCSNCNARVDMVSAKRKAEQKRDRYLTCPKCGEKVATLN